VYAWGASGANTTPYQVAHFVLRNTSQNGGEKEAGKGGAVKNNNSVSENESVPLSLAAKTKSCRLVPVEIPNTIHNAIGRLL